MDSAAPTAQTRYAIARPHVVADFVDGEVVIVNLKTGMYFALFSTSALTWQALSSGATVNEVLALCTDGDAAAVGGREGMLAFLSELVESDLVRPALTDTEPLREALNSLSDHSPWQPLTIHKHADLQDILLLDPVHDSDDTGWPNAKSAD